MTATVHRDREAESWAGYAALVRRAPLSEFEGVTFPHCEWMAGSKAVFETVSKELGEAGVPAGSEIFVADNLSALWLFSDMAPLQGGAPWYYGQLTGLENADYLVIPKCAFVARQRGIIVDDLNRAGAEFSLLRDNEVLALFRVER